MTSLSHTLVTSDDTVTVTVTKSQVTWKNIEHSRRNDITCNIHVDLEAYTWSFKVGYK